MIVTKYNYLVIKGLYDHSVIQFCDFSQ